MFTDEAKRYFLLSQNESILNNVKRDFNLPLEYEIGERIHNLNESELDEIIEKHLPTEFLVKELLTLNEGTQDGLISYYRSKENTILKLKHFERVIETVKSNYSKILDLNELLEKSYEIKLTDRNRDEVLGYRSGIKSKINELVLQEFKMVLGDRFEVKINGKFCKGVIPKDINIRDVNRNSIVIDFRVEKGVQDVKYNGKILSDANYFFFIWLGDLIGFPSGERFFLMTEFNIESISPLINGMYVYDSCWWDGTEVCGVLDNMCFPVLAPQYNQIEIISKDYFKAYRINPNGETDENGEVIEEGWEYYNKNGKKINEEQMESESDEKYIAELNKKYQAALDRFFGQELLKQHELTGTGKFSVWNLDFNDLFPFLKQFLNDPVVITRYPNTKHYLVKDFYVCMDNLKGGKENFGVGVDPSMNVKFNYDEE